MQMARLNEPAAPTESVESLKRKFLRQNRDIARANSTQSLRIRNLENETSKLLSENLELREQILSMQIELENGKSQNLLEHTGLIRSQLEGKLLEISALITCLGDDQPARRKTSIHGGKIVRASPIRSPAPRVWNNLCSLSEAIGEQDGRLPPILENKSYPRKTLERQELAAIVSDAAVDTTDSPEIGPPPVSQFVDEDPVKIDLPTRTRKEDVEEVSALDPALSINLEQRKKRRDSIRALESKRASRFEHKLEAEEIKGQLKAGAKRKLSVRDDEDQEAPVKHPDISPDDFKFTRIIGEERAKNKPLAQSEKSGSKAGRETAISKGALRDKQSGSVVPAPSRKILAPKSVNDSPRKTLKATTQDDKKVAKAEVLKTNHTKERSQEGRQESTSVKLPTLPPSEATEIHLEPETPAAPDIFSPLSSQPSTARAESRDTPPPSDLELETEGPRASRRARGSVSYAEPNLRDKMRRPTKELVDAVVPEGKAHRRSIVNLEEESAPVAVRIKAESKGDDSWKRMPIASSETVENSPLSGKAYVPEVITSNITSHRTRRESILSQAEAELPRSGSGSTIAALLAENRKSKAEAREKALENERAVAKAMARLDIYEFRDSSSPPIEEALTKVGTEQKASSRFSRRHSYVPAAVDTVASDMEPAHMLGSSASRRRRPVTEARSSSGSTESTKDEDAEKGLKRASSATSIADSGAAGSRMSARRRSMML